MIVGASKYGAVRRPATIRKGNVGPKRGPGVFVPTLKGKVDCLREWFWRELKEGGWLHTYLRREKARTPELVRRVARFMSGFQQNNKSDFRRVAAVPARTFHRWKEEDEHFWEDDENLRSLKRDNPDMPIYVGPRKLPSTTKRITLKA